MRNFIRPAAGILLSAALAACGGHGAAGVAQSPGGFGAQPVVKHPPYKGAVIAPNVAQVCGEPRPRFARCHSLVRLDTPQIVSNSSTPGYHPADFKAAYKLNVAKGRGQTIAIVDAFDDPNAEADLKIYRSNFGLPVCSTANGCFKKVNQTGGTTYPPPDVAWAAEISIDMASAICPNCYILLVEADSNSFHNLALSVDEAATLGANEISNSYGGPDGNYGVSSHYKHPHHVVTASSGGGFSAGPQFPASLQWVTAVGGTTLIKGGGGARGWQETVWGGSGSGCSAFNPKPKWQHDIGCNMRMMDDVAAVADPSPGVAVYDTYGGLGGWNVFGGTSISSPIIAGVYALAGNSATVVYGSYSYTHASQLFDITSGGNGPCSGYPPYFCTGEVGYDGPSGNGTPNGSGGF